MATGGNIACVMAVGKGWQDYAWVDNDDDEYDDHDHEEAPREWSIKADPFRDSINLLNAKLIVLNMI